MRVHRACAYDGCKNALEYFKNTLKFMNGRFYCSHECLDKQYSNLGYKGALHFVHQQFGPNHPVTKQIQKMKIELSSFKKDTDYEDRACVGWIKAAENEARNARLSEKCL